MAASPPTRFLLGEDGGDREERRARTTSFQGVERDWKGRFEEISDSWLIWTRLQTVCICVFLFYLIFSFLEISISVLINIIYALQICVFFSVRLFVSCLEFFFGTMLLFVEEK